MASTETVSPDIPLDNFAIRIAIARVARGWNVTEAAHRCGINPESWRLWEKTGRSPQDYEEVCKKIATGTGWSRTWLIAGGPLRSRCLTLATLDLGQLELDFAPQPVLFAV